MPRDPKLSTLPIRSASHKKEDASKVLFEKAIAPWIVVSESRRDYGIDLSVELIRKIPKSTDESVTGKRFSVQLKSTSSTPKEGLGHKLRIPVTKLNYWMEALEPVMLVYVNLKLNTVFYKWIDDNLSSELTSKNSSWFTQDSVTIYFTDDVMISQKTLREIEMYVLTYKHSDKYVLSSGKYLEHSLAIKGIAESIEECCNKFDIQLMNEELSSIKKEMQNSMYMVAIAGLSRAGKSTLINALIRRELSPVDAFPTTGVPIYIYPTNEDKALISFKDGRVLVEDASSKILDQYTTQQSNRKNIKGVSHVRINIISKMLEKGFALCDIPGLDDADKSIREIAMATLIQSNATIYVMDVSTHSTGAFYFSERNMFDFATLRGKKDSVFLIFNKIDSLNAQQLEKVKEYVDMELKEYGIDKILAAPPIYISSKDSFENRMGIKACEDTVALLEEALWHYLINQNKTGNRRLESNYGMLLSVTSRLSTLAQTRLLTKDERTEVEVEIKSTSKSIQELSNYVVKQREIAYDELAVSTNKCFKEVIDNLRAHLFSVPLTSSLPNEVAITEHLSNEAYRILNEIFELLQTRSFEIHSLVNRWINERLKQIEIRLRPGSSTDLVPRIDVYIREISKLYKGTDHSPTDFVSYLANNVVSFFEGIFELLRNLFTSNEVLREKQIKKIITSSKRSYSQLQTELIKAVRNSLNDVCNSILTTTEDRTNVYLGKLRDQLNKLNVPLSSSQEKQHHSFIECMMEIENDINSNFNFLKIHFNRTDIS